MRLRSIIFLLPFCVGPSDSCAGRRPLTYSFRLLRFPHMLKLNTCPNAEHPSISVLMPAPLSMAYLGCHLNYSDQFHARINESGKVKF